MNKLLEPGDVIKITADHSVYANIPEHFVYSNKKGSFKLTTALVMLSNSEFSYLLGNYIVVRAVSEGGGTGHGPHDMYPDGHHVYCEKVDDRSVKINFYQSGCFTAMIENIEPIGKAKMDWVIS